MTTKYLLDTVKQYGKTEVTLECLSRCGEFLSEHRVNSLESTVLELDGHFPIREYRFDMLRFESWCNANRIRFCLDNANRSLILGTK